MKKSRLLSTASAVLFVLITGSANAAFIGILPQAPNTDLWQAYYDDLLDITWIRHVGSQGLTSYADANAWVSTLTINGIGNWHLPSMGLDGSTPVDCITPPTTQAECMSNQMGHMYAYGEGTRGVTEQAQEPFDGLSPDKSYWSSTADTLGGHWAFGFGGTGGGQNVLLSDDTIGGRVWAVHDGNAAVPLPPALWLFGSGLLGLIGMARRKKAA